MANPEHLARLKAGVEAWNVWRAQSTLIIPDLAQANLVGAKLSGANLSQANLSRAKLSGAKLSEVDLYRANLSEAELRRAELIETDLSNAVLRSADMRKAQLTGTDLTGANLEGADLSGAMLRKANLMEANLSGAKLSGTTISETNLNSASLSKANCRGTLFGNSNLKRVRLSDGDLSGAILISVDLDEADLSRANLRKAILRTTKLRSTILAGANLMETVFHSNVLSNCDLSSTEGLDHIQHEGPSSIGIDTIFLSNGKIPEVFLRGVGVPEIFITYQSSMLGKAIEFYSCFISYSHSNKAFARRLHDALQGRGIRCWLDEHELLPGHDVHDEIDRGIRLWDKVILCASEASLTSWWVDKELDKAFEKEEHLWRDRKEKVLALIPLDLDGYLFSGKWTSGKASLVTSRLAGNFAGWESDNAKFERELERVVRALRTDGGRLPPPPKLL